MAVVDDDLKTPALVWIGGCAIGGAGGLEASAALAAAVGAGVIVGPEGTWRLAAAAAEGAILAICQWAALRRLNRAPALLPFTLAAIAGATILAVIVGSLGRLDLGGALFWTGAAVAGAVTGAVTGAVQSPALARTGVTSWRWIAGSAVGWAIGSFGVAALMPMLLNGAEIGDAAAIGAGFGAIAGAMLGLCTMAAAVGRAPSQT